MSNPKAIKENIARAKNYIRRNELIRSLNMLQQAVEMISNMPNLGTHRFEIETSLNDVLSDCNQYPEVLSILTIAQTGQVIPLKYMPGKAAPLAKILKSLHDRLDLEEAHAELKQHQEAMQRFHTTCVVAKEMIVSGDKLKGRVMLRKALEDFAMDSSLYIENYLELKKLEQWDEAAEMLENGIERFPKETELYSMGINLYIKRRNFSGAEALYRKVLTQFGSNPITMSNMAKLYYFGGRRESAINLMYEIIRSFPEATSQLIPLVRQMEEQSLSETEFFNVPD